VEESHAIGILGKQGRGACEAAGLEPEQVEVICASMGTALASVGGFCVGHHEVSDHKRFAEGLACVCADYMAGLLQSLEVFGLCRPYKCREAAD
jgi:serine palmitoyltransferase